MEFQQVFEITDAWSKGRHEIPRKKEEILKGVRKVGIWMESLSNTRTDTLSN